MRQRGERYRAWADPALHCRTHDEMLEDGTTIDVQVRLSSAGSTQMFIGVYATSGMHIFEEICDCRPGESMTRALAWGVGRARRVATEAALNKGIDEK
ncbi:MULTISPECIES: hypothetical protein [unclassified Pseudomonas]|uniref:hypothetical protein n=1 Tax=unclassified Pseudomonas TaxID=196821 RepID=UPI000BDB8710|nr:MULTISPECIES: hypothetical protein [unclassified Pseudomonas]PAM84947.1 hypothetical protein CES87_05825 [Pseudomonas sp. ERMR1:02]